MPKRKYGGRKSKRATKKRKRVAVITVKSKRGTKVIQYRKKQKRRSGTQDRLVRGLNPYFPEFLYQRLTHRNNWRGDVSFTGVAIDDTYTMFQGIMNHPLFEAYARRAPAAGTYPTMLLGTTAFSNYNCVPEFGPIVAGSDEYKLHNHLSTMASFYGKGAMLNGTIRNTVTLTPRAIVRETGSTVAGQYTGTIVENTKPRVRMVYGIMSVDQWRATGLSGSTPTPITQSRVTDWISRFRLKSKVFDVTSLRKVTLKTNWSFKKLYGKHEHDLAVAKTKFYTAAGDINLQYGGFQMLTDGLAYTESELLRDRDNYYSSALRLLPVCYVCIAFVDQRAAIDTMSAATVNMDIKQSTLFCFGDKRQNSNREGDWSTGNLVNV